MSSLSVSGARSRAADRPAWGWHALGLLAVAVWIAVVPHVADPFVLHLLNTATLTAISAMALTVLTGTAGLLSLGTAAFLAIGAFSAGALISFWGDGASPWLVLLLAGGVGLLIGGLLAVITIRAVGIYLAVGTVALHYLIELVLTDVEVKVTGATGFMLPPLSIGPWDVTSEPHWWYVFSVAALVVYVLLRVAIRGPVGAAWIAAREIPAVASAMGVSQVRARVSVFMTTSFITSMAGALMGYYTGVVQIGLFPFHLTIMILTVIVLGGSGNLFGAVVASYAITALPHALSHVLTGMGVDVISRGAGAENLALGLILIVFLLRVPQQLGRWLGGRRGRTAEKGASHGPA